jgi:hypothetical protein
MFNHRMIGWGIAGMFSRGSEWREWDLHIHSPASFHWDGERFGSEKARNNYLIDEMIRALNDAASIAFGLMDYWTFDGWFELKTRQAQQGAPAPWRSGLGPVGHERS